MHSMIVFEVEHGEADRLQKMIKHILAEYSENMAVTYPGRPVVTDHRVLTSETD